MNIRPDQFLHRRTEMINRLGQQLKKHIAYTPDVLWAMHRVHRHLFVPESIRHHAYSEQALSIGFGQTISRPYTVAQMTMLLCQEKMPRRLLEVGTGCGYQTAVLCEMGIPEVYSIERIQWLYKTAQHNLRHYRAHLRYGDGYQGWEEAAPFDAIIVTAAGSTQVPAPLVRQLAVGGKLVIPLYDHCMKQQYLWTVTAPEDRDNPANWNPQLVGDAQFVPLLDGTVDI